jgi:sugar lactone lactonase YvrE
MNSRRIRHPAALVLALGAGLAVLHASQPQFWTVANHAAFIKGEVDNAIVTSDGRVTLGPRTTLVHETKLPFIWDTIVSSDGAVLLGTGSDGHVLRLSDGGGRSAVLFDAPEIEVHALAQASDGSVFAGSAPDGKVYRIRKDGQSSVYFDPEDRYIWALAVGRDGTLYVATGDKGRIYRVSAAGKGVVFYETKAAHVTSLAFDASGRLLAATASPGRLFRIDSAGKGFVLLDSTFKQVQSIRVVGETLYVCGLSPESREEPAPEPAPKPAAPPTAKAPVAIVTTDAVVATVTEGVTAESAEAEKKAPTPTAKGALYRIDPDGLWATLFEFDEDVPYDVMVTPDKAILVATGDQGKVYRLEGDPVRTALVGRAGAKTVTRLTRSPQGDVLIATSNPGTLMRLSADRAPEGTYLSDVRDAVAPARWGTIRWRADVPQGATIEIATRSGNTSTPDATWSEWAVVTPSPDGAQVSSPPARYLQWRAKLTAANGGSAPSLTSVTTAYLARNLRPQVTSVTAHPPGIVFQRPFSTGDPELAGMTGLTAGQRAAAASLAAAASPSVLGRKTYQKGLQTIQWEGRDEDDDPILYNLQVRRVGDPTPVTLARRTPDTIYTWDSTSVPDGTYIVRVEASDADANAPGAGLTSSRESVPFEVDNTPPTVQADTRRSNNPSAFAVLVRDSHSPIQRVEWSADGVTWREAFPMDGIADSTAERYGLTFDGRVAGQVIVRASDSMANIATALVPVASASGALK